MQTNIMDIAGVRVICSFEEDVFFLAKCLKKQSDIEIITEKDYISHPKPNGYRSLHLTIRLPVFFAEKRDPCTGGDTTPYNRHGLLGKP